MVTVNAAEAAFTWNTWIYFGIDNLYHKNVLLNVINKIKYLKKVSLKVNPFLDLIKYQIPDQTF